MLSLLPAYTILLQPVLTWTSSSVIPIALISRLTQSFHLCFGLPLLLLPGCTISNLCLPTLSWSRLFLHMSKPPQSCFPAPLCDVLYLQSLPDVIISHIVSFCVLPHAHRLSLAVWQHFTCYIFFCLYLLLCTVSEK